MTLKLHKIAFITLHSVEASQFRILNTLFHMLRSQRIIIKHERLPRNFRAGKFNFYENGIFNLQRIQLWGSKIRVITLMLNFIALSTRFCDRIKNCEENKKVQTCFV